MKRVDVEQAQLGGYVLGRLDAARVPAGVVASKSGVHPSTLSKFLNGIKNVSHRQLFAIGYAVGLAEAEAAAKAGGESLRQAA